MKKSTAALASAALLGLVGAARLTVTREPAKPFPSELSDGLKEVSALCHSALQSNSPEQKATAMLKPGSESYSLSTSHFASKDFQFTNTCSCLRHTFDDNSTVINCSTMRHSRHGEHVEDSGVSIKFISFSNGDTEYRKTFSDIRTNTNTGQTKSSNINSHSIKFHQQQGYCDHIAPSGETTAFPPQDLPACNQFMTNFRTGLTDLFKQVQSKTQP